MIFNNLISEPTYVKLLITTPKIQEPFLNACFYCIDLTLTFSEDSQCITLIHRFMTQFFAEFSSCFFQRIFMQYIYFTLDKGVFYIVMLNVS